jgi:2-iminoacetate synthase ThiH
MNRPARITQAEIERAIRAAKKAGATVVELQIGEDAVLRIPLVPDKGVAESSDAVL